MTQKTADKVTPPPSIEPLLEEYKHLFAYANSNALTLLKIPPAFLAGVASIIIYKDKIPELFGLTVSLALFTMLVWIGYCHSMVNGLGIILIEIEHKINNSLELDSNSKLTFHTRYITEGSKILPGFQDYSNLITLALVCVLSGALFHFWLTMSLWGWHHHRKICVITILVVLNIAPLLTIILAEKKTSKLKQQLLSLYSNRDGENSLNYEEVCDSVPTRPLDTDRG